MTHGEIIWQILSALAVILTVLATYLKGRSERKRYHAETSSRLVTPSGDTIGEVVERTHDLAAVATMRDIEQSQPMDDAARRLNADPNSPVKVNGPKFGAEDTKH